MANFQKIITYLSVHENFSCFVYKSRLVERNENDFKPCCVKFVLKIISNEQELNDLLYDRFDLSPHLDKTRERVKKGAIACLVFMGKELASMEWAAVNPQAKAGIDIYPCKVDFENKEAYAGGVWTNPEYRGKGLHTYVYYKIYDFLREQGVTSVVSIVEVNNSAALKAHDRFAPEEEIISKAHYIRFLGLRMWRENNYKPELLNNRAPINL